MKFTVLFWNIWLDNQMRGNERSDQLLAELRRLHDQYSPDVIGLNEVLQHSQPSTPFVSDFLDATCGYSHSFFAPASNINDDWLIGSGFYAKKKPQAIRAVTMCPDSSAKKRGYDGCTIKAISAKIQLDTKGNDVHFIVAHPPLIKPYTVADHYQATAVLEDLVRSKKLSKNIILGGDFNEPDILPRAFRNDTKDILHMRTGRLRNPTWRHNAWQRAVIRANLDQLYYAKESDLVLDTFTVVETNISDHRPLVATFRFA